MLGDVEKGWANKEGLRDHEMYCIFLSVHLVGDLWNDFTVFNTHDPAHSKKKKLLALGNIKL